MKGIATIQEPVNGYVHVLIILTFQFQLSNFKTKPKLESWNDENKYSSQLTFVSVTCTIGLSVQISTL